MKRMLFNATHQEELRVAIVDGQKLIDLDIETAGREQRKGNIYKGVITRIEPGLEACFVNYGEERHGFLPFKEVSRSYFKDGVDVKNARIQDALHEGQELIIQVEKEERGNKGAALTTFISLAGRYLVLMPNNPRGGGVSRRVEGEERQELRETMDKLDLPHGMSIIARTAGIGRTVEELQWDLSYLMQLWNAIDSAARDNPAPVLIYLESSLVIRAIRDYYSPEIGEILIDTDDIHEQATSFMGVVMAENVHQVKRYKDDIPLFSRFQIEHQIETAYARNVQLPSGGSIVIDHTEALVAIDVNSARATKGSDIEETALRTNLEAADEVARQLRLRDLGGLIVIDFIDMDDTKNQRAIEQRLRDALRFDRARVQMGKISRFGLMELSRQRLRPALNEGSHVPCPRCTGTGVIRDSESSALHILRLLQEEAMKEGTAAIHAHVPIDVATFLLNEKRSNIAKLESRLGVNLVLIPSKHLETPHHNIERLRHDDPRLDDSRNSIQLADEPEEKTSWTQRNGQDTKKSSEALVKTITPAQPAPINKRARKTTRSVRPSKPGILRRLLSWISGTSQEVQPQPKKRAGKRAEQKPRNQSRSNQSGNVQRNRKQDTRSTRAQNDEVTSRSANNADDVGSKDTADKRTVNDRNTRSRTHRNRRRTRNQNDVGSTSQETIDSSLDQTPEATERPQTEAQDSGNSRRRRRRPRRGRRGKQHETTQPQTTNNTAADTEAVQNVTDTHTKPEAKPEPKPEIKSELKPKAEATAEQKGVKHEKESEIEQAKQQVVESQKEVSSITTEEASEGQELVAISTTDEPALLNVDSETIKKSDDSNKEEAETIYQPSSEEQQASENRESTVDKLAEILKEAGLEMVETSVPTEPYSNQPEIKLGRPRKQMPNIEEEELQQIETIAQ